ncbi:MAG: hypothetical protein LBV04_07270 [Deferribacteraceae bacterium]|jgi:hypothetical protein|nr:hypothetical protein [Deferribacteraceae bacterium]
MDDKQKLAEIIMNLIMNTKQNKISWQHSFNNRAVKYIAENGYTISVEMARNPIEAFNDLKTWLGQSVFIYFYDSYGEIYAKTNDVEMNKFIKNAKDELCEMYNLAKQQALGIEEKLGELESILPKLPESEIAALKING